MWKKSTLALAAAAMMIGTAIQASHARPYNDPYYNNQYNDRQYNDRNYDQYNNDRDYRPPPPPPPPPGYASEQYRHDYRAEDDPYYDQCRRQRANNQAGGLIIGAIAGGLFGNA